MNTITSIIGDYNENENVPVDEDDYGAPAEDNVDTDTAPIEVFLPVAY